MMVPPTSTFFPPCLFPASFSFAAVAFCFFFLAEKKKERTKLFFFCAALPPPGGGRCWLRFFFVLSPAAVMWLRGRGETKKGIQFFLCFLSGRIKKANAKKTALSAFFFLCVDFFTFLLCASIFPQQKEPFFPTAFKKIKNKTHFPK